MPENNEDPDQKIIGIRNLRKCVREIDRHNNSAASKVLEKSLFVSLFSAFDKYIGDLVSVLYNSKPELYKNINKEISFSDILSYESIGELRQVVLDKEIESIRRKGYSEQFSELENKFSIKLKKFESWPTFIECSQRRNLFTHCDGVVSKQYIDVCNSEGYKFKERPDIGEQLIIGSDYFLQSCQLLMEVAVMLGQTLWRKAIPDDLSEADNHLNEFIFSFLHMEHWSKSIALSKFALALPNLSSDQTERVITVNYAIALKAIDEPNAAINVLDRKDWSATSLDFKLANAVLRENYGEAKEQMIRVGKKGELLNEMSYHDWPLFREYRDQQEFFEGYEEVYGYKYSVKLSSLAEEKKSEVPEPEEDRVIGDQ